MRYIIAKIVKHLCQITVFALLLLCFGAFAQTRESLPVPAPDPAVSSGVLPEGTVWYVAENKSSAGEVDVSILHRVCQSDKTISGDVLAGISLFGGRSLEQFLATNGIAPGREGYVEDRGDHTVWKFRALALSRGEAVLDSLLYASLCLMQEYIEAAPADYGTNNQVLIISGDVNRASVVSKLTYYSMMLHRHDAPVPEFSYKWDPDCAPTFTECVDTAAGMVNFDFRLRPVRTGDAGTFVPVLSHRMDGQVSRIVRTSLMQSLEAEGIVPESVEISFDRLSPVGRDAHFTVSVKTDSTQMNAVQNAMRGIFASISGDGVTAGMESFSRAASTYSAAHSGKAAASNDDYTERCISHILYGASLATNAEKVGIFSRRQLVDSTRLRLFRRHCDAFRIEGADSMAALYEPNLADTLLLPGPSSRKAKLTKSMTDTSTGGSQWTFSNGAKVICKRMATSGETYFSLFLEGGPVSGWRPDWKLHTLMSVSGIVLDVEEAGEMVIVSGYAPSANLETLLKYLSLTSLRLVPDGAEHLLTLIGDRSEYDVQKLLKAYVNNFATYEGHSSGRRAYSSGPARTGAVMSADMPLSSESYMTSRVFARVLEYNLVKALCGKGVSVGVSAEFSDFPLSRLNIYVDAQNAPLEGFASGEVRIDGEALTGIVRDVMSSLASGKVDAADLAAAKSLQINEFKFAQGRPEFWLDAVRARWCEGKDLYSKYEDKIKAVDAARVASMAGALNTGMYIVRAK